MIRFVFKYVNFFKQNQVKPAITFVKKKTLYNPIWKVRILTYFVVNHFSRTLLNPCNYINSVGIIRSVGNIWHSPQCVFSFYWLVLLFLTLHYVLWYKLIVSISPGGIQPEACKLLRAGALALFCRTEVITPPQHKSRTCLPKGNPKSADFLILEAGRLTSVIIWGQYVFIFKAVCLGKHTAFFQCFPHVLVLGILHLSVRGTSFPMGDPLWCQ